MIVVVVVTELCVERVATRTLERLVMVKDIVLMHSHPPISASSATEKPPCSSSSSSSSSSSGHRVIMNILHFSREDKETSKVTIEKERERK